MVWWIFSWLKWLTKWFFTSTGVGTLERSDTPERRERQQHKYVTQILPREINVHDDDIQRAETRNYPELPRNAEVMAERYWNPGLHSTIEERSVSYNGIALTRHDLCKLQPGVKINDEVINAFLSLIAERSRLKPRLPQVYCFSTFFYTSISTKHYSQVRRWTKDTDIFAFDILMIPIHLELHWCLAVVDLKGKCISYYDSLHGDSPAGCFELIRKYLEQESLDKRKQSLSLTGWRPWK